MGESLFYQSVLNGWFIGETSHVISMLGNGLQTKEKTKVEDVKKK